MRTGHTLHQSALEMAHVHGVRRLVSEHQFFVGELSPRITVRLYESQERDRIEYEQSHFIRTPLQADAYQTSTPWGDDALYALNLAAFGITQWYDQAVREGHQPNDSWLVPNPRFHNFIERSSFSARS